MKISIKYVATDKLIPYARNAKTHPPEQIAQIAGSLKEFGFINPVIVDKDLAIIAGHGRVLAAQKLGLAEVPTLSAEHLTDAQVKAFRLADNRIAQNGSWDDELLKIELLELSDLGIDLTTLGFDEDDLPKDEGNPGNGDPDDVPPDPVDVWVKPGDLFQLGDHRLLCGDSTNREDVARLMNGERAELCFTSPPYSDQREYNGGKNLSTESLAKFISASAENVDVFAVNLGISRKDGEIIPYWDDYIREAKQAGLKLLSWNVWDQLNAGSASKHQAMFAIEHEWIFVFGANKKEIKKTVPCKLAGQKQSGTRQREKDGATTLRGDYVVSEMKKLGTVIRLDVERANKDVDHPAKFPVDLPVCFIEACSSVHGLVYEPFTGSGTTIIASEKTGRKCYGMELDPKYCQVILERWAKFSGKQWAKVPSA